MSKQQHAYAAVCVCKFAAKTCPILIREALEKNDMETLDRLHADYCEGCGECSYVCPARIELKNTSLKAKGLLLRWKKEKQASSEPEQSKPTS